MTSAPSLFNAWRRTVDDFRPAGIEASIKLEPGRINGCRYLLGVDTTQFERAEVETVCRAQGLPAAVCDALLDRMADANQVLFGFEALPAGAVYKIYLEFWERLSAAVRRDPRDTRTQTLFIGWKWIVGRAQAVTSRYTCFPLLALPGIRTRLDMLYRDSPTAPSLSAVRAVLKRAAPRIVNDSFVYVEVDEPSAQRRSFDLNFYKAGLSVGDVWPVIAAAAMRYGIDERLAAFSAALHQRPLGHLAGGSGRGGEDFTTVYYEIDRLPEAI